MIVVVELGETFTFREFSKRRNDSLTQIVPFKLSRLRDSEPNRFTKTCEGLRRPNQKQTATIEFVRGKRPCWWLVIVSATRNKKESGNNSVCLRPRAAQVIACKSGR